MFGAAGRHTGTAAFWRNVGAVACLNVALLVLIACLPANRIFGEQGAIEVSQVIVLLGIAAIFAVALSSRVAALRPLLLTMIMLTIAFAMREGDLRVWDVPAWAKALGSGSVRNPLTVVFALATLALHIPVRARQVLWAYAASPYAVPVAGCFLLLLCGKIAENLPLGQPTTELFEEMFEFNAYIWLAVAAVALVRRSRELAELSR